MKTTISISGSNCNKFDIATYTNFHQEMYRMIAEFGGDQYETFRFTPEFTNNWARKINVLVDVNKVIRATVDTEKLAELDEIRDRAVSRFFNGIKYGLDSFNDNEVEAAKRLNLIRKKYNGIQRLNYDRQTASIDGLLQDISNPQAQNDISILNLWEMEMKMRDTNEEFRRLYGEVSNKRAATKMPTFAELKAELNPIWEEVVQHLQCGYLFTTNDTEKQRIYQLAEELNQRIKQIKDNFNRSQGMRKKDEKTEEEELTTTAQ